MLKLTHNQGSSVVVKSFLPTHQGRLDEEHDCLINLQTLVPLVPKIIGKSDDGTALLLSPVGHPFSAMPQSGKLVPCGNDFLQLIEILKKVHAMGFVHRDVRLYNFFRHPTTKKVSLCQLFLSPISSYQTGVSE